MKKLSQAYYEAENELWGAALDELENSLGESKKAKKTLKILDQARMLVKQRMIEQYGINYRDLFEPDDIQGWD